MTKDRDTFTHEGTTYTYKSEHGGWYADPQREATGTLCMPTNIDGTPALDEVGDIEISWYESAGEMCDAMCNLCMVEYQRDLHAA